MLIKYLVMCRDQNAGGSHNIKVDNSTFERVEQFSIWKQPFLIKILFRKKLRAGLYQGVIAIILYRIFCLPPCYGKI
jgi:hypothetical protein